MLLTPCPACRRHVADAICVFCGADVDAARGIAGAGSARRLSRALVFASAAALTPLGAGCGGKAKPAAPDDRIEERHHGGGGCVDPDPARIEALEKQMAEAKTDEEKAAIGQELQQAHQPTCMPYGAPPARRRVV